MSAPRIFDAQHYTSLNTSRGASVSAVLSELIPSMSLRSALDVGCGLGYFTGLLESLGLAVSAVDGRKGNVEEAQRRFPKIPFCQMDAQDPSLREVGRFDLVFCFGLLYHLENPMLTIRHLHAMTQKLLLVESVTFPGDEPIMALVDEGHTEDQGLNHLAFYPTEACLVKMLYRSGFSCVYTLKTRPDHPEYHEVSGKRRTRTMLAAAIHAIQSQQLERLTETSTSIAPWDPNSGASEPDTLQKLRLFMTKRRPKAKVIESR